LSNTDFGGKLRQARERRGISLRQIAASTKISVAALEALERNDVSRLPGGIFSRAFVRSYSIEVGLDPDETVREFLERFHGESQPAAAPVVPVPEEESNFESQQRMAGVVLKLVLISIPIAGAILYFTLRQRPAEPAAAEPAAAVEGDRVPEPAAAASPSPSPRAAPPPAAPARGTTPPETQPVPAAPVAAVPAAGQPVTPADQPLTLDVHPTAPCWVSLTVDGVRVFARVMQPGEKEVRKVRDAAVIEIGDAGAFAFSIDGRPGRSLGESGQVTTARISKETVAQYLR
jgi:cytoskeleton protein RodZ